MILKPSSVVFISHVSVITKEATSAPTPATWWAAPCPTPTCPSVLPWTVWPVLCTVWPTRFVPAHQPLLCLNTENVVFLVSHCRKSTSVVLCYFTVTHHGLLGHLLFILWRIPAACCHIKHDIWGWCFLFFALFFCLCVKCILELDDCSFPFAQGSSLSLSLQQTY